MAKGPEPDINTPPTDDDHVKPDAGQSSAAQHGGRLDDDVERVFHLIDHYRGFVCARDWHRDDERTKFAVGKLEGVLRKWMPPALRCGNDFLIQVNNAVGNHENACELLENADLRGERMRCLRDVASQAIPEDASPVALVEIAREKLRRWRELLPRMHQVQDGHRVVADADLQAARLDGMYWDADLDTFPSRAGAAFTLAAACDAVAASVRALAPRLDHAPAVDLALRLRELPDWASGSSPSIAQTTVTQMEVAHEVERLLGLFEIELTTPGGPTTGKQAADDPTAGLGNGGPAKTFDAVWRAILSSKTPGSGIAEGDETTHGEVMKHLRGQDRKKARDYLAPSGRLCSGRWIQRVGPRVVLTARGAREATRRWSAEQAQRPAG